ncbi:Speckle-type POZ protein-like [Bienertia sinuspersici]
METQDHKKPKQPGHEGHSGGVHICNKCGWPFPNSHPSAKQRRAHKKVCGTVEGYRLDNDAQNNTHMMDEPVAEHVSEDELKSPSVKFVERTISRRSSSGVGSRSSRSTRSEDDVFTDAVTDFTDSPGPGEASDGGMQRFYSMQRVTQSDLDDMKQTAENASADNVCSSDVLEENQDQAHTVQKLEGEIDRVEAGFISQDLNPSSTAGPALVPDSVTVEYDKKVDTSDESKEIASSKEKLEVRAEDKAEKASEDVYVLKTADETILGPHYAGEIAKSTGVGSTGSENDFEKSEIVDAPGILCSVDHQVGVNDPVNGSNNKASDVMEDHGSQTGANEDVYVLSVPDNLPLHQHPEIAVEDLDYKGGKINGLNVPDSATETGNNEEVVAHVSEFSNGIDLETSDSKNFSYEDDVLKGADAMENELKQDVGQKTAVEESTFGEPAQKSDIIETSDTDINELKNEAVKDFKTENLEDEKVSSAEEEKPTVRLESVFPQSASSINAADNLDITYVTANTCSSVENNAEHGVLQGIDGSEVSRKELAGSSLLAECAISGIQPQVTEISNIHSINDTGNDEKMGAVQTHLDGKDVRSGGEGNEAVAAESAPGCDLSTVAYHDITSEPLVSDKIYDHDDSDKRVDSGDVSVGLSPIIIDKTADSSTQGTGEDGTGTILKSDDIPGPTSKMAPSDTVAVCEDEQQQLQSTAAVNDIKQFVEETSGAIEGDRTINQHVAVSVSDILPDSSSRTDSLEGNWGSVSVMSAISDTSPATPPAEENGSVELKPVVESQHCESKMSGEPQVGIETKEGASEIETLEEHQQKGAALQTALSSSIAHADNTHGEKRDEEIVSKVTNWSADKNSTPLKTLLGEATAISRAESPIHSQIKSQKDEIPVAKNGFPKTEDVILSSNVTTSEASKEEMGKEWNSPARYPVNIKTEKRKTKGRPYWAPFLCCSSVNAR